MLWILCSYSYSAGAEQHFSSRRPSRSRRCGIGSDASGVSVWHSLELSRFWRVTVGFIPGQENKSGIGCSRVICRFVFSMPPCVGIGKEASERLQSDLLSCKIRIQRKQQRVWCMEAIFSDCPVESTDPKEQGS